MKQETLLTDTSASCRTKAFAEAVLAGEIVAGPDVRGACQRHLNDLALGPARGLVWCQDKADRAIGFFEDVLRLNGGDYEGSPFLLAPWQAFVVGSLFGWYAEEGFRRFRLAYIETGKGSGKSPLIGGSASMGWSPMVSSAPRYTRPQPSATRP
ncbi:terminase large subunit domain-containing protein [Pseudomonas aeruginosa]|uniref:terminase large subunit domain-containing protein n=1 Tax=Pseudomonas aeruginosa TaxID=287 RepID=UPI0020B12C7F|nr:terminase large subunit [Pseudomonas aeruginosa]